MIKSMLVLLIYSFFGYGQVPETKLKSDFSTFINTLQSNGVHSLGNRNVVTLKEIENIALSAKYIFLDPSSFNSNPGKTRRSAFYANGDKTTIYLNKDSLPTPGLLLHEILRDKQYEVSGGLVALEEIFSNKPLDESKLQSAKIIKKSVDIMVDRFGTSADNKHMWVGGQVQDIHSSNSVIKDEGQVGEGGDVSGGGGDGQSFKVKAKVLALLVEKLKDYYGSELNYSEQRVINKVSNLHMYLSLVIFFETNYAKNAKSIEYGIATDKNERIRVIPYLIQVPVDFDVDMAAVKIVNVILQSDLFMDIPSLYMKYYSSCACVTPDGTVLQITQRCDDPRKKHPSMKSFIEFYLKDTEKVNNCKIKFL